MRDRNLRWFMGRIRFNVQETIQKEYELDLADSEKVIRRAEEIKAKDIYSTLKPPINYYYECAIQELLEKDEICATLVNSDYEEDITSAWVHHEED